MPNLRTWSSPIVLAASLAALPSSWAGPSIDLGDGLQLDWSVGVSYALGVRTKSPHPLLAGDGNAMGNDGNNNFKKGALTANRLSALLESRLSKGNTGLVLTASTFYDDVYHRRSDYDGSTLINTPAPFNRFTADARHYHGGYTRFLDTYVYTSAQLGEDSRLDVRVGRQVVNWGEATYFANLSGAQGPFDGSKSDIPGTEVKEAILPEDQVSVALDVNANWSLLGHWQFGFHETILPAVGSYQSNEDLIGPGGSCMGSYTYDGSCNPAFGFVPRIADLRPSKTGQWGIGTRYRLSHETEVGLYYLNYHDRSPAMLIANDYSHYRVRYFDDIKMLASTISTSFGKVSAYGEISYRQGTPVMVAQGELPSYVRGDVTQLNIGGFYNIGRTAWADDMQLLAEVAAVKVNSISDKSYSFDDLFFGSRNSLAFSGTWVLNYPGITPAWDLVIPISYSHQLRGRSLVGSFGGGEGDRRYSVGASFSHSSDLSVSLSYVGYLGSASLGNKTDRSMVDRDQLSVTLKYAF